MNHKASTNIIYSKFELQNTFLDPIQLYIYILHQLTTFLKIVGGYV